ncbi:hypothetical protein BDF20DRAFT_916510 [Mycotypha africana]|uniref:uncharacterized protein n=1 Tax=Mycotypha africana TaxID=64632 RepID=UPI002301B13F|nr:uncharacterized protein BDF20DRAFT_916510 [Mycotypha africana]KAI8969121.1 hypothetical protein BDF20DRAFT_916510 [Mycotypha africana]
MKNSNTKKVSKIPLTLDVMELSKHFTEKQQQDVLDLHRLCLSTPPGRIRGPRTRKVDPKHIPRPVNCFMIYRKEKQELIRRFCPTANHRKISKIIAEWWAQEQPHKKATYITEADKAKKEHAQMYPDYTFRPKARKAKKVLERKNQILQSANSEFALSDDWPLFKSEDNPNGLQAVNYTQFVSPDMDSLLIDNPSLNILQQFAVTGRSDPANYSASVDMATVAGFMNSSQSQQSSYVAPSYSSVSMNVLDHQQLQPHNLASFYGDNARFIDPVLIDSTAPLGNGPPQHGNGSYAYHLLDAADNENNYLLNGYLGSLSTSTSSSSQPSASNSSPFQAAAEAELTPGLESFPTPAIQPASDALTLQNTPVLMNHSMALLDELWAPRTFKSVARLQSDLNNDTGSLNYSSPLTNNTSASFEYFTNLYQRIQPPN